MQSFQTLARLGSKGVAAGALRRRSRKELSSAGSINGGTTTLGRRHYCPDDGNHAPTSKDEDEAIQINGSSAKKALCVCVCFRRLDFCISIYDSQ